MCGHSIIFPYWLEVGGGVNCVNCQISGLLAKNLQTFSKSATIQVQYSELFWYVQEFTLHDRNLTL